MSPIDITPTVAGGAETDSMIVYELSHQICFARQNDSPQRAYKRMFLNSFGELYCDVIKQLNQGLRKSVQSKCQGSE